MDAIKQWILSLCGATAITGVFQVFLSNTNFKKVINTFLSIFVLFYTIIPLSNIKSFNINFDFENLELNEFSEENYEQVIITAIKSICEDCNVEVISVDIDSYINDDCLVIEKIEVETDAPTKSEEIEAILKNEFGFEVSVNWKMKQ